MIVRTADLSDLDGMINVRFSVKENVLSNPALVTREDYVSYLTARGKGWVCDVNGTITGFAIADLKEDSIWALFVIPEFEKIGIGRMLHDIMLAWYFAQGKEKVWLSTAPGTRAEQFYIRAGWKHTGMKGAGELLFEMTKEEWQLRASHTTI